MGLFKRNTKPSKTRIAEGGGGDSNISSPSLASDDLGLFGEDSDESDDDATIDRYANTNMEKTEQDHENKKVSTLLSRMTPEELFHKYDTDGSGQISLTEFLAMLPDLGIKMTEAKATRIFKKCDTDGGGEIDLTEFKTAMFTVDPVSGNTLGFKPTNLLAPRDAFDLFDTDGTGQIDELEFADVLEYFGMDISDEKQETIFKKYDKDRSGSIDYHEFRSMWIQLSDPREELIKRGIEIPKFVTTGKLQKMLEKALEDEEQKEKEVFSQAQFYLIKQREKQRRQLLGHQAMIRAQDELAAALDAAGQVYVLGKGRNGQFTSDSAIHNLFPGSKLVNEIWGYRVNPTIPVEPTVKSGTEPETPSQPKSDTLLQKSKATKKEGDILDCDKKKQLYVRRRPENDRWGFQSPPKLNQQTLPTLKAQIKELSRDVKGEEERDAVQPMDPVENDLQHEEIPIDREMVRSLRFRSTIVMKNTGALWGKGILHGALSNDVALVATGHGDIFTWGGKDNRWENESKKRNLVSFECEDDEGGGTFSKVKNNEKEIEQVEPTIQVTPRSSIVKMNTKDQLKHKVDPQLAQQEKEMVETAANEAEEEARYNKMRMVAIYYGVWEPPPSHTTRMLFMEQVILPLLDYTRIIQSMEWRGLTLHRMTKLDLILKFGECLELEVEINAQNGHEAIRTQEQLILEYMSSKDKKLVGLVDSEKSKMIEMWAPLRAIQDDRLAMHLNTIQQREIDDIHEADAAFESMIAKRFVHFDDICPELTPRGINQKIEVSGITSRGPPLHSPRGRSAVMDLSVGGSHAALLLNDGLIYTWGIGSNGRLGQPKQRYDMICFDSNHPQLVDTFRDTRIRQVSCAYSHSASVTVDGKLYVWGSTTNGKLGVGVVEEIYEQYTSTPLMVKIPGKRLIRSVSCGASHTGAVSTTGELFMWGSANGGRLGLGPGVQDTVVVPTLVRSLVTCKVQVWQVSCGHAHSALCTEIISENRGGNKKLIGGQVFVCGGALPLGKYISTWEIVSKLDEIAVKQVSCGVTHTAAVAASGELYTWGRNEHGCTGHPVERGFIAQPEVVRALHVEPYNLALGKPCRQINIYNEQGPQLGINGDVDGDLKKCIHTQLEDQPWWEVDLGQPAVIERVRVWNRTDVPHNPSKRRDEYTSRLFPFWILISEFPFKDLKGKEGLRAAKVQSTAFEQFDDNKRMTEWIIPSAQTIGQYVRIQLQNRNFLHVAEVEVFGVYSAFNYVGRVGTAQCGDQATLVIIPPTPHSTVLDDYYLRAIQADADNATILRQYEAYESSYRKFGRGTRDELGRKCCLCRVFRECELCTFLKNSPSIYDKNGELPKRIVGDRLGLKDLVHLATQDDTLEVDGQNQTQVVEMQAKQMVEQVKQKMVDSEIVKQKPTTILSKAFHGLLKKGKN